MPLELKSDSATWDVKDSEVIKGGDPDTVYTVRRLTLDKHREIKRKHTKPATYRRQFDKIDEDELQDDLFDYVLVGWSGVVVNGEPVPCEWAHKKLIDVPRRIALLDIAGMNEIAAAEAARGESFRAPADVR